MRLIWGYFFRFGDVIVTRIRYYFFRLSRGVNFDTSAPIIRSAVYFINALLYLFPSRHMFVIGVVGAEGTTIAAELLHHMLVSAGKNAGLLSKRVRAVNNEVEPARGKNLSQVDLQQFLSAIGGRRAEYAIIELSLDDLWNRAYLYTNFDLMLVTGFQALYATRAAAAPAADYESAINQFLQGIARQRRKYGIRKTLVLNMDDPQMALFTVRGDYHAVGYATKPVENSWVEVLKPASIQVLSYGARIEIDDEIKFETRLMGESGLSSSLAAVAVLQELRADLASLNEHFKTFRGTPGRFEHLYQGQLFDVIADGAKTVEEFAEILPVAQSLANQNPYALLICVLGASAGDSSEMMRAKTELAAAHCNRLFLTVDDAGGKNPKEVLRSFVWSLPIEIQRRQSAVIFREFLDRRRAIEAAVESARDQDVVLTLGKINDRVITGIDGKSVLWDERKIILESIAEKLRS